MRWFAPLVAVALGGCNLVFGLEEAGGAGDDDGAIDAPGDGGDGGGADGRDGSDGGGGSVVGLVAGAEHTCVMRGGGTVKCWGAGGNGQLGYGDVLNIGDNEPASAAGDVMIMGQVVMLAAGGDHTCALLDGGTVACWGTGERGQLGYGDTATVGDNEPPSAAGIVQVGTTALAIAAGTSHTCAVTLGAEVICWGANSDGRLGYGNTSDLGDNDLPSSAGTISGPPETIIVAAGGQHTCAVDSNNGVMCWGSAATGQLGYGNINNVGDNEVPLSAGVVTVGELATQVVTGDRHTCVLLANGGVRCWGSGAGGRLGTGNENNIGDNETPASVDPVDVGGAAVQLAAGGGHTCALLNNGAVRCWGTNDQGQLGYGNTNNIGDNETPSVAGDVPLGNVAVAITAGGSHTCALTTTGAVYCWGSAGNGQLGYGTTDDIGDTETPASAGPVPLD